MLRLPAAIAVAALALASACARDRRPDPRIDELSARMLRLEARHAELEAIASRLEALAGLASRVAEPEQRGGTSVDALAAQLEQLALDLGEVEQRLAEAPAAAPARPPGPDPNAVYAVPIAGAPYTGPAHARVNIVQAFEFA